MLPVAKEKLAALYYWFMCWFGVLIGFPSPERRHKSTAALWYASDYVYKNHWVPGAVPLMESIEKTPPCWIDHVGDSLPRMAWPAAVIAAMWCVL